MLFEIHATDLGMFKQCRRKWFWASHMQSNLERIIPPTYFYLGSGIHFSLECYYSTGELPENAFTRYHDFRVDKMKEAIGGLLPGEQDVFDKLYTKGFGMMQHYHQWIEQQNPDEGLETIAVEKKFKVSINNPHGRQSKRICLAGKFDGVIRDHKTGKLWLREYKTTSRKPNPAWLEIDDQVTVYCIAASKVYGEEIAGIKYRFLFKQLPEKPWKLKNGKFTTAIKSSCKTTYPVYKTALEEEAANALPPISMMDIDFWQEIYKAERDRLYKQYETTLRALIAQGYSDFFIDIDAPRSSAQLETASNEIWEVGLEMARPSTPIYTSPSWIKCPFCPFQKPCKALSNGEDYETILDTEYQKRVMWDNELEVKETI